MPKTESNTAAEKEQHQALQIMTYVPQSAQPFEDDTIDLYELWITLWNKKWLVIGVTVIAALGSVVYAMLQPPVYKAEALLVPPDENKFQSLNVQGAQGMGGVGELQGVQGISSGGVFAEFNKNLRSRILQKKFILDFGLMELLAPERTPETRDEDIYKGFAEMIKIETGGSTSISIELHDAKVATQWVNDYVNFMDKETISKLIEKIQNSIANQIRDVEYMISSKREMAKIRREDQITGIENTIAAKRELVKQRRLDQITGIANAIAAKREGAKQRRLDQILRFKEAIIIADSLGINKREDATSFIKSTQMNLDIITSTNPLYYAGSKELQAEINNLEQRKSDDPYISGLRDLQEQLALLRQIKIEDEGLHAVTIDQAAYPSKNRIKPNRRLIVSLGTVVGLFLGIFLVFIVSFIQNQKEAHSA